MKKYIYTLCLLPTYVWAYKKTYDVIVIGGGPTGIIAAQAVATHGKQVALIESETATRNKIAQGDMPLKALIKAGQVASMIHQGNTYGLPSIDIQVMHNNTLRYVQHVIQLSTQLYEHALQNLKKVDFMYGKARFVNANTIEINNEQYYAHRFIIATGGTPYIPPIKGIELVPYYTKDTFFALQEIPKSIMVVGQGPLGIELATALHNLGTRVIFFGKHKVILPNYDFELVDREYTALKASGIDMHCGAHIEQLSVDQNMIEATYCMYPQQELKTCRAEAIIFALDLIGNTDGLNLGQIGVEIDHDGIVVDDTMQTSVASIYACGDVVGRMYTLTRVAYYQAQVAAYNASKHAYVPAQHARYSNVSSFIQGIIPLGAIGLTEQEARKIYGNNIRVYKRSYADSARAILDNATDGFIKCICLTDGTLLGVHVAGAGADQIIDHVHIGENFEQQFNAYQRELRTSPNYLDILWHISMQSAQDFPQTVFGRLKKFFYNKCKSLFSIIP